MKDDIKLIQAYMNWALGISLAIDGEYGNLTADAVSQFQQKVNIDIDSRYGKDTRAAAKKFEKNNPTPSQKEVKASQPAQSYNASIAGTYKVNSATGLNVRDGAGTQYKVLTAIPNGMKVENYGYFTGSWLYIAFEQGGTKYIGFASKDWLTIS
jgi:peptidoglycan hydrolase-like protein with peptidoglycan-binding domain